MLRNAKIVGNGSDHLKLDLTGEQYKKNEEEYKRLHIFGIDADSDENDIQKILSSFKDLKIKIFPIERLVNFLHKF